MTSVTRQAGRVHVRFAEDAAVDPDRLLVFVARTPEAALSPARLLTLPAPRGDSVVEALLSWFEEFAAREAA